MSHFNSLAYYSIGKGCFEVPLSQQRDGPTYINRKFLLQDIDSF